MNPDVDIEELDVQDGRVEATIVAGETRLELDSPVDAEPPLSALRYGLREAQMLAHAHERLPTDEADRVGTAGATVDGSRASAGGPATTPEYGPDGGAHDLGELDASQVGQRGDRAVLSIHGTDDAAQVRVDRAKLADLRATIDELERVLDDDEDGGARPVMCDGSGGVATASSEPLTPRSQRVEVSDEDALDLFQRAFREHGAVRCRHCDGDSVDLSAAGTVEEAIERWNDHVRGHREGDR